jgi:GntR family transcriptional regulator, transcriptional repressor for pyruvate dehydrogenase complex
MTSKHPTTPPPVFDRIKLERLSDKVANQLKKAIFESVFKVGDRLPSERDLAREMGVSRPSVREAIQQLELQGILETVHGGGSIVRNIAEQEIQKPMEIFLGQDKRKIVELTEVRALMETWAARRAAENRSQEELQRMQGCLEEMERDLERGTIRPEVDIQFHTEIAAAAHNTIFLHVISSFYQLITYSIRLHREEVFVSPEEQQKIFNHHLKVFKAIQKKDARASEASMNEHLQFVIKELKRKFLMD